MTFRSKLLVIVCALCGQGALGRLVAKGEYRFTREVRAVLIVLFFPNSPYRRIVAFMSVLTHHLCIHTSPLRPQR